MTPHAVLYVNTQGQQQDNQSSKCEVENTAVDQITAFPKTSAANPSQSVKQAGNHQTIDANEPEKRT